MRELIGKDTELEQSQLQLQIFSEKLNHLAEYDRNLKFELTLYRGVLESEHRRKEQQSTAILQLHRPTTLTLSTLDKSRAADDAVENLVIEKRSDEEKESTPLTSLSQESTNLSDQDEQRQLSTTSIINSQEGQQTVLEALQLLLVSSSKASSVMHASSSAASPVLVRSPSAHESLSNTPSSSVSSVILLPLSTAHVHEPTSASPAGTYRSYLTVACNFRCLLQVNIWPPLKFLCDLLVCKKILIAICLYLSS